VKGQREIRGKELKKRNKGAGGAFIFPRRQKGDPRDKVRTGEDYKADEGDIIIGDVVNKNFMEKNTRSEVGFLEKAVSLRDLTKKRRCSAQQRRKRSKGRRTGGRGSKGEKSGKSKTREIGEFERGERRGGSDRKNYSK